jgi:hypothetical protein
MAGNERSLVGFTQAGQGLAASADWGEAASGINR